MPKGAKEHDLNELYAIIEPASDLFHVDARLKFGEYKGKLVSVLSKSAEGLRFLMWLLKNDYPAELKEVVAKWIDAEAANGFPELQHLLVTPQQLKESFENMGKPIRLFGEDVEELLRVTRCRCLVEID